VSVVAGKEEGVQGATPAAAAPSPSRRAATQVKARRIGAMSTAMMSEDGGEVGELLVGTCPEGLRASWGAKSQHTQHAFAHLVQ